MLGLTDSSIFYENLKQKLAERITSNVNDIEQLGLLDDVPVVKLNTPLDTLSNYLSKRLEYGRKTTLFHLLILTQCDFNFLISFSSFQFHINLAENERDLVILRHEFVVRWQDQTREEKGIDFVVYGKPANQGGPSAMALTVGYPTAIATKMILDDEIQQRGVILPFAPDVFMPMISRLRAEGLTSNHTSRILS